MSALVRILAWRRIADRPVRAALTAAGVAAGVAFLFSILSLNAQLSSSVRDTAAVLPGPRVLQVTPASPSGLPEGLADELATDERIVTAAPVIVARTTATNGDREAGLFVLGMTPEAADLAPDDVDEAELEISTVADERGIGISRTAARRLGVGLDTTITIHASTGKVDLPVVAIASSAAIHRINGGSAALMFLDEAQRLFGRGDRVDQILLLAAPDADLAELRRDLAAKTKDVGLVGAPGEHGGDVNANFALMQLFTNFVGAFIVVAALMLVFHTMSTATAERRTEIALARSLGSSRRQLLAVTLAEAGILGVAGTIVGLGLGALVAELAVPFTRYLYDLGSPVDLPSDVTFRASSAAIAAIAGIGGAVAGAVLPARAAGRAAPIDAFRPAANAEWRDPTRPDRERVRALAGVVVLLVGIAAAALRPPTGDPTDVTVLIPVFVVYLSMLILVPTLIPMAARAAASLLARVSTTTGRLAADALRANPRRTTVNVMALLIPVAAVVLTAAAMGSSLTDIGRLSRAIVATPLNVDADSYVGVLGGSIAAQPMAASHQQVLEAVPGVQAVLPYQNAAIALPSGGTGIVYGVPLAAARRAGASDMVAMHELADDPGAFTRTLAAGQIAASHFGARILDLEVGSRVTLPTPSGPRSFTVGALFEDWTWQGTFAVDLDTYREVWGDDFAFRYAIVPADGTDVDDLADRLEAAVTAARMPAQVHTREDAVAELEANTTIFLPLARAMTFASLLFAALALGNAAFTAVTEQRWTLALRNALGMSRRQVARSLALEAVTIGVLGAVGGAIVGAGLGFFALRVLGYQVALTLHYSVPWGFAALSIVLGVAVAAIATAYPRRIARRLTIIEALRFE